MNSQLNDQVCDLVYKCSEAGKMVYLESNYACITEESENFPSNSFEVMSISAGAISCENCCYSDCNESSVVTSQVKEIQSTREKLTFDWVKAMSRDVSKYIYDSNLDSNINSSSDNLRTDSETDISDIDPNTSMETCSTNRTNDDIVEKLESSKDSDLSELTFCFADVVTEENYDSGFSFSTKGSLTNCTDDDFLEDDDFELVFSNSPLSASNLPGWADIMSEASELSQSFDNEIFVDFFECPAKSKALKKVNERWVNDMCGVDEEPRDPKKVTFAPLPNLVTVHCYQKSFEENQPSYDTSVLDRIRFQNRIEELSRLLTPILTLEHRSNIILRNSLIIHD